MASAWSASLYGGLGAEPPVGSRGKAPGGGQGAKPPEAEDLNAIYMHNSARSLHSILEITIVLQTEKFTTARPS
jgi:hypothetical protein